MEEIGWSRPRPKHGVLNFSVEVDQSHADQHDWIVAQVHVPAFPFAPEHLRQTLEFRTVRDDAMEDDLDDDAALFEHERGQARRTTKLLRKALRLVLEKDRCERLASRALDR